MKKIISILAVLAVLGIAVVVTQAAAISGAAGRAGLGGGAGGSLPAVALGRNAGGKCKSTVTGGVPLPGVSTGGSTGRSLGLRSGIAGSSQLRQRHRGGAGAAGAGTLDGTGSALGGVDILGVAVAVAQCRTGGSAAGLTLLRNGTGSRGVVVGGLGDGLGLGTGAVVTGIGLGTGGGAGGSLGDGAAVPAVGTGAPGTVVAVPPAGLHGVHTAGIGRNRQVRGLVPFMIPAVGGISAVHTAEDHVRIAGGHRTYVDVVALGGQTDPRIGSRTVVEEVRGKTGAVRRPFAVDLQHQLRGRRCVRFCRPHHAEDHTDRADQQQNAEDFNHFPLHKLPPVLVNTYRTDRNQPILTVRFRF